MLIDRYGDPKKGKFTSPDGISIESRSIPAHTKEAIYHRYEVVDSLEVEASEIAPWFGDPGGGVQYVTDKDIKWLIDNSYLEELK